MKNGTIVIYEPDKELSKSLALVLEDEFKIFEVPGFGQALDNAIEHQADTLILDIDQSEKNKLSKIEEIRKRSPDTKIILLYVYNKSVEESGSNLKKLSDAVLYKPLDIKHFLKTVERVNNS